MTFKELLNRILKKKTIVTGTIVSFLITYSFFFGFLCDTEKNGFRGYYPIVFLSLWVVFLFITILLWTGVDGLNEKIIKKSEGAEEKELSKRKKIILFFVSFALLFAAWIPCWLASWPGFFSYDAGKEFVQIWYPEVPIWGRISIIHSTLLLLSCKAGMKLFGDFNSGIAIFTAFHLLLGAAVLSYETVFLYSLKRKKIVYVLTMAYFMFSPTVILFSGCSNSTIFGSLLASLMIIKFYEIFILDSLKDKSKAYRIVSFIAFAALSILTCHIRTSFMFLFSLMMTYVIVKMYKKPARIVFMIAVFIMLFVFNKGLVKLVNAENPPDSELMSIPVQQLANVYVKKGDAAFTLEEKEVLLRYYAEEHFQYYCPWCADAIKLGLNNDEFEYRAGDFWKLWIKKGLRYPFEYLEAWNYLSYEAWYPFTEPDGYTRRNYIESEYRSDYFKVNPEAPAELDSKIPALYDLMESFSTEAYVHRIPILGQLCTIGYQYLFLLFAAGYSIHAKRKGFRFINALNLAYFTMMLFAPIVLLRYHLLLFYLFPITAASLFGKSSFETKGKVE